MEAKWVDGVLQKEKYSSNTKRLNTKNSLEVDFGVDSQNKKPRLSQGYPEATKGAPTVSYEESKAEFMEVMALLGMNGEEFSFPEPKDQPSQEEDENQGAIAREPMKYVDEAGLNSEVAPKYGRLMIIRDEHFIQNNDL